jgi:trigger factor
MRVTESQNQGLKREFKVVLPSSDIRNGIEERLVRLSKQVKLKGFRPGKVPMDRIKKLYKNEVVGEVLEKLVSSSMSQVLKERNLRPAADPKITLGEFDEEKDLEYSLAFEVYPEVPAIEFSDIKIKQLKVEVGEKDLKQGIDKILSNSKEWVALTTDRPAKQGDTVLIDFEGTLDGEVFQGGTAKDFQLELGSNRFIPGYEEQLIGVKKGDEKIVKVTFPENYFNKELAGKGVEFKVNVHEIQEAKLPEFNEEFAKKKGFESLEKLEAGIKEQIAKEFDAIARIKMKKDLFDQLDKKVIFDIPQSMLDMEKNELIRQGATEGEQELSDADKKELDEITTRRVKLGILMAELALKNQINVTGDELRNAVIKQAQRFPGQEYKIIEHYKKNENALNQLKGPILEEKVIDFLFEKTREGEASISVAELTAFYESEQE